jgi:hypothetical protein
MLVNNEGRSYHPAMGPRIPYKRKLARKNTDEVRFSSRSEATVTGEKTDAEAQPSGRGLPRDSRERGRPAAVTHRSPTPYDGVLPCCGRTLTEISGQDQVTTDPQQVTCGG